ncbi:type IV secretory system conjugative DNA transfer family protein [Pseudonocardia sp. H11422]|uniref:type IV secretory system conjugative DNA transfer family protein n=1 Tax=Pseudonocardia sp. H11422 TaxID=2835866 RepID=UPI001BDBD450|nr:TraM recognition domain-containing protein [Pseudonocardia sp. H11422]
MTSHLSSAADRDLVLMGLICAALVTLAGAGAVLVVGLVAATVLAGGPLAWPPLEGWAKTAITILGRGADPGAAAGEPWASALAGHPGLYWATTGVVFTAVVIALAVGGALVWRWWGPTPAGHATRAEIRAELSLAAARRTAAWTRPGLSPTERRRAPLGEVGAPLHRGPAGPMCSPLENPTGTLAPTQSGKSRRDLVHKTLDAPGALLCSTTKPDLLEFAALARTRRPLAGPVLVYDATGATAWPARLRWSPIAGCTDLATAYRRAHTMVEASAVAVEAGGGAGAGNDKVFRERATFVLAAYLLAAALHGRSVDSLIRWATAKPPDLEPVGLLEPYHPQLAGNLQAEIGMVARTSDAVWMSVRRVIEPLLDPHLRELCTPRPGEAFDARSFIGNQGSLFLIAGQHQAAQAAPLLTALAEHWLTTAQEMALDHPTRRLDPPATAVLDELPNATPMPQLPDIVSDSAGRGVVIHWAAQSLAQLEDTFTPARARQLLDNTTTLSVWGSLKDVRALEWVSTLGGHHERLRHQAHTEGLFSPGRSSIGTETVPTYRPGDVRTLHRGRVMVLHRALRPILARTIDVTDRPDWKTLHADVETIRAGSAGISPAGYALSHSPFPGSDHPSPTGEPSDLIRGRTSPTR